MHRPFCWKRYKAKPLPWFCSDTLGAVKIVRVIFFVVSCPSQTYICNSKPPHLCLVPMLFRIILQKQSLSDFLLTPNNLIRSRSKTHANQYSLLLPSFSTALHRFSKVGRKALSEKSHWEWFQKLYVFWELFYQPHWSISDIHLYHVLYYWILQLSILR